MYFLAKFFNRYKVWLGVCGGLVVLAGLFFLPRVPMHQEPAAAITPQANVTMVGQSFLLDIADTPALREQGLSSRTAIPEYGGMLFLFDALLTPTFWMKDMYFPIDILWIRGERIVGTSERAAAPVAGTPLDALARYTPTEPVDRVIEIRAGSVERLGIRAGQSVQILLP